ncbi:hypothetical protein PG990_007627 [Apiospora arundinis]
MPVPPDPRDLGPDPRCPGQTFSRDAIVVALSKFYSSLPHIDPSRVRHAPPGGWPSITAESLARIFSLEGCSTRVVDLLRHLPYIDHEEGWPWITPETMPLDYRRGPLPQDLASEPPEQQLYWRRQRSLVQLRQVGAFDPFPPWVVQLTTSPHRDGDCWMLDTSDGTLTKFVITGAGEDDPAARYNDTDPRAWRNAGEDKTYKLEALLAKWAGKYRRMEYLGVPGHQSIRGVVWRDAEFGRPGEYPWDEAQMLKRIYQEHGWPDQYKRDECRRAVLSWMEEAHIQLY